MVWAGIAFVLVAIFTAVVRMTPAVIDHRVDSPGTARVLYGLDRLESNGEDLFRWSAARWGIALFGFVRPAPLTLSIEASATRPDEQPAAILSMEGDAAAHLRLEVARAWRTYHVLMRPIVDADEHQVIRMESTTFRPGGAGDGRELGIAVSRVRAQQLPAAPGSPIPPRALFLALTTLLVMLVLRRAGIGMVLVLVAGGALTLLLGTLQLRAPGSVAYWFPNVWHLLGIGALALVLEGAGARLPRRGEGTIPALPVLATGVTLSLVGTLALWLRFPPWAGLVLAVVGAGIALLAIGRTRAHSVLVPIERVGRRTLLLLLAVTAVALVLRLYRINSLPVALWRDEVYHGQQALEIWRNPSYRPVYVPSVDLPALLFYLTAPVIGTFGPDLWTVRIVPALAGALTPLALWFALRPVFGGHVALIAAWCMAVAAWNLYMSRWGFPVILDPLFVLMAIGCIWRALTPGINQRRAALWAMAGGVSTALAVYTYHTGRLAPLSVALFAVARLWQQRQWRGHLWTLLLGTAAFALVVTPIGVYAMTNRNEFTKRVSYVSLFNRPDQEPLAPLSVLEDNVVRYVLMWHVRGDHNARHYAPDRPMLDPIAGTLLLLGAGTWLLARRSLLGLLLLGWLLAGLIPGIFSDVPPHAMRTIGALAPACAFVALGLDALLPASHTTRRHARVIATGALLLLAIWNVGVYFRTTNDQREMFYSFDTTPSLLARGARAVVSTIPPGGISYQPYLWENVRDFAAAKFLLDNIPVGYFDGTRLHPPPTKPVMLLLPGGLGEERYNAALRALGPGARLLRAGPLQPGSDDPIYLVYGAGDDAQWLADRLPLP